MSSSRRSRLPRLTLLACALGAAPAQAGVYWGVPEAFHSKMIPLLAQTVQAYSPPPTRTPLPTGTATLTFTPVPTATVSPSPCATPTASPVLSPSPTATASPTATISPTASPTASFTPSPTPLPTRYLSTAAGDGSQGYGGDGGPATAASPGLNVPNGSAVDPAGNLYIADAGNDRVREVVAATGRMVTVAGDGTHASGGDGGLATRAQLSGPGAVALDAAGNLFITEGQRVRRVDAVTGLISTLAGDGSLGFSGDGGPASVAQLHSPAGLAVDAAGNVFIADANNDRIREVLAADGRIVTVAGGGGDGFGGDGGPATSALMNGPNGVAVDSAGDLFIADLGNQRIRRVDHATGLIATVAGDGVSGFGGDGGSATAAGAHLNYPVAVAVDAAGDLFIADIYNKRVREVLAASGILVTVVGNGTFGFAGDGGPAAGPSAELSNPAGVAVDGVGGALYIADEYNARIRKVDLASGTLSTVAGDGCVGYGGEGLLALTQGAHLDEPGGVAVDAAGDIFLADTSNHRVREVLAASGVIVTVAGDGVNGFGGDGGPATAAGAHLSFPGGLALNSAGDLYIADAGNHRVRVLLAADGTLHTVAGDGLPVDPVHGNGDGGPATAAGAHLSRPTGLAVDAAGDLYIADADGQRVRKVMAGSGTIVTLAGDGTEGENGDGLAASSPAVQLASPSGVAVDAAGNVFIADATGHRVREVRAGDGRIVTVAGDGVAGFGGDGGSATAAGAHLQGPTGLAVDAAGDLFIADTANERIRQVALPAGLIFTVAGDGGSGFNGDGGVATAAGAHLSQPQAVAVGVDGALYIAEQAGHRIRKATP